jgi:drug/metabolite transporter (DMT)-like permease
VDRIRNPEACAKLWMLNSPVLVVTAGVSLGLHFALWVWSLALTSLAESLLFVTISPLLIVGGSLLLCKKVGRWELSGTLIGFAGCGLVAFGSGSTEGSSAAGDLVASLGAVMVCGYLLIGKVMREERGVALFYYLCPINFLAAVTAYICAVAYSVDSASHIFSWIPTHYAPYILYLGIVPGIIGHALINFLLVHLSPLLISVFITMEPIIGSVIGWALGIQGIPEALTWAGGAMIIVGNALVTVQGVTQSQEKSAAASLLHPAKEQGIIGD